jgi:hypothetical protein
MVLIVICTVLVLAAAFGLLLRRNTPVVSGTTPLAASDIAERYRPMARLLDEHDFELLNSAGDRRLLSRLRSQRRVIFRGYLRCLRRDHAALCACLRSFMIDASDDRKDLAVALLKMEWTFRLLLVQVNARLAMHTAGVGTVDVTAILGSVDRVLQQLESMKTATAIPVTA